MDCRLHAGFVVHVFLVIGVFTAPASSVSPRHSGTEAMAAEPAALLLILDPLIWLYTLVMGLLAIPGGMFDRSGPAAALVFLRVVLADHETIVVAGEGHWLDQDRHFEAACLCSESRVGARYSVLYTYLPFQFRIAFKKELLAYPVVGLATQASGQVCIDQQNPAHSISSIRAALKGLKAGAAAGNLSRGRTHAGRRN